MTWLVTGGAGYIGAHVVRAFRDDGIDVVVIDDLSSGKAEFVPDGVPFVQANLLDGTAVRQALEGVEGVVHLAGQIDGQHRRKAAKLGQQVGLGVGAWPRLVADAAVPGWSSVQMFDALDGFGHLCPQSAAGIGQG